MTKVFKILSHLLIVLALVFITIEILDWYNPYMNFLGLHISTILMIVFCFLSLLQSVRMISCKERLWTSTEKKTKRGSNETSGLNKNLPTAKYLPTPNTRNII